MSNGDWGRYGAIGLGILLYAFMFFDMGASYSEHRTRADSYAAQAHANSAENITRSCLGLEALAYDKCVAEQRETQRANERSEQDLGAQQGMAEAAWWMVFVSSLTLLITATGVWFVKRTLDATLQAVEDTGQATEAMQEANRLTRTMVNAEVRPYLFVDKVQTFDISDSTREIDEGGGPKKIHGSFLARVRILLKNAGKVPARNIRVHMRSYRSEAAIKFFAYETFNVEAGICASGFERKILTFLHIPEDERQRFNHGIVFWVLRLTIVFYDDAGRRYVEKAGFSYSGSDDEFYLFDRHRLKTEKNERVEPRLDI